MKRIIENNGSDVIQWLVDTKEKVDEYLKFLKTRNKKIQISIEIDIGLHRGGFNILDFKEAIQIIKENEEYFELKGLMGYDVILSF
jgi:D-serine deaminase-like pyridoxal phosphate-dependent protein